MTPVITWDDLTPDEKKSALLSIQWQRESAARKAAELAREQEKLRRMDPYPRALRTETEPIRVEEHEAFGFADGIKGRERFKGPWPKRILESFRAAYRRGYALGKAMRFR